MSEVPNLQRISVGYLFASMSEIFFVKKNIMVDSPMAFVRKYYTQGLVLLDTIMMLIFFSHDTLFLCYLWLLHLFVNAYIGFRKYFCVLHTWLLLVDLSTNSYHQVFA